MPVIDIKKRQDPVGSKIIFNPFPDLEHDDAVRILKEHGPPHIDVPHSIKLKHLSYSI